MKRLFWLIAIVPAFAGCSQEGLSQTEDVEVSLAVTRSETADGEQTEFTYRALVFSNISFIADGTYYCDFSGSSENDRSGAALPWNVDDDGNIIGSEMDIDKALYVSPGAYSMVVVSPGHAIRTIGETGRYGFLYNREPGQGQPMSISRAFNVDISGFAINPAGISKKYVLDLSEVENSALRERRSEVNFIFKSTESTENSTLKDIRLKNLISSAYYNPIDEMFYSDADVTFDEELLAESITVLPQGTTLPESGYVSVLSQDYTVMDKNSLPVLDVYINNDPNPVSIHLTYNFLPQYRYTYTITVSSMHISVSLSIMPWDEKSDTGDISAPPSIPVGTFDISDWTSREDNTEIN